LPDLILGCLSTDLAKAEQIVGHLRREWTLQAEELRSLGLASPNSKGRESKLVVMDGGSTTVQ
jgi:hypothetical protein